MWTDPDPDYVVFAIAMLLIVLWFAICACEKD